jgi:hypothetical protein
MSDRPLPRRPEFDEICNGWGSDSRADLEARMELVLEFQQKVGTLTLAEEKILRAMSARHVGFKIAAGEMEPAK